METKIEGEGSNNICITFFAISNFLNITTIYPKHDYLSYKKGERLFKTLSAKDGGASIAMLIFILADKS